MTRPAPTIAQLLESLGAPTTAAVNIAHHVAARYLIDAADQHNHPDSPHRTVRDRPNEQLVERVPAAHRADATAVTLALAALCRAAGGPACPEVGLPAAYAAEAVLLALCAAQRQHTGLVYARNRAQGRDVVESAARALIGIPDAH